MEEQIMTQTIPVSQARQKFGELINEVYKRNVRIIVEKSGIPVVALVSLADLERWSRQDRQREEGERIGPEAQGETTMTKEASTIPIPTKQELARRQALVNRLLKNAEKRIIAPLSTADLVHQARKERDRAHERWSR